jgi:hypothetical protein
MPKTPASTRSASAPTPAPLAQGQRERRTFKAHANLIVQAISRQAGSLGKAVMEGVMNSIDAGSTRIEVTATEETIQIRDDGRGFTAQTVDDFFEWLGAPHEDGDARFGSFRIGRGQCFSFGVNRWRSGALQMDVDFKRDGLDWDFTNGLEPVAGCTIDITLYTRLYPSDLVRLERELRDALKWVDVPVVYNGKPIAKAPVAGEWTHETDTIYLRATSGSSLTVYNQGVLVRSYGGSVYGVAGEIVSKVPFKLNTARNDLQSDCPVWKKVRPLLAEIAGRKTTQNRAALTDADRDHLAVQFKLGELRAGHRTLKLFTDVTGEHWSLQQLELMVRKRGITTLTSAPPNDARGDRLQQHGTAVVLADTTLARFEVESVEALVDLLRNVGAAEATTLTRLTVAPLETVAHSLSTDYRRIGEDGLTPTEGLVLEFLRHAQSKLFPYDWRNPPNLRTLFAGESSLADGWTDGAQTITVHRKFLTGDFSVAFWSDLGILLAHEYSHNESSQGTHVHGPDFYRLFHDTVTEGLGRFTDYCVSEFHNRLKNANRALPREVLRLRDRAAKIAVLLPQHTTLVAEHAEAQAALTTATAQRRSQRGSTASGKAATQGDTKPSAKPRTARPAPTTTVATIDAPSAPLLSARRSGRPTMRTDATLSLF